VAIQPRSGCPSAREARRPDGKSVCVHRRELPESKSQGVLARGGRELIDTYHQTPAEFEREARLAIVVKLFEMKRLSSGQAALLAGIDLPDDLPVAIERNLAL
jgi:hypothetical protein